MALPRVRDSDRFVLGSSPTRTEPTSNNSATAAIPSASSGPPPTPLPSVTIEEEPVNGLELPPGRVNQSLFLESLGTLNLGGSSDPFHPTRRANFHPGTRVIIDLGTPTPTGASRGRSGQGPLLKGLRAHGYWPIRLCFEEHLQAMVQTKSVQLALRGTVGTNGRLRRVLPVREMDLPPSMVRCMVESLTGLDTRTRPRRALTVSFTVKASRGDVVLPQPPPSEALPTKLDLEPFRAGLRPLIVDCFARGRQRDPALFGRLVVELGWNDDEQKLLANEVESQFSDPQTTTCVLDVFRTLRFEDTGPFSVRLGYRLLPPRADPMPASPPPHPQSEDSTPELTP